MGEVVGVKGLVKVTLLLVGGVDSDSLAPLLTPSV